MKGVFRIKSTNWGRRISKAVIYYMSNDYYYFFKNLLSTFTYLKNNALAGFFVTLYLSCVSFDSPANIQPSDSLEMARLSKVLANFVKSNQLDEARLTVDSIMWIAEAKGLTRKKADCYYNYSLIERKRGNAEEFLKNASIAAEFYLEDGASAEAAKTYTYMAQMYIDQKNYNLAGELFYKSLQLRENCKDSVGVANNLINLGNLRYIEGKYEDASDYFYRALRFANEIGNNNLAGITLMNMANVLTQQKNYDKAVEYLEEALDYHRKDGNRREEANVLHNIGIIHYEKKDYERAKDYFMQALTIKEELKTDPAGMIKIYNNLGLIAKEENNPELAEQHYNSTLKIARLTGDKPGEAVALNNLGSLRMIQGSPVAQEFFLESLQIAQGLGLKKLILSNYDNLQQFYSSNNDWKKAFDYSQKYMMLNDSIFNEESAGKIIELQTKYDTEMKEKENQILRDRERIQLLRNRLLTLIAVVLAIIATSFYIMFRLKRQSLSQSRELFNKETEISQMKLKASEERNRNLEETLFAEEEIKKLQAKSLDLKKNELVSATMLIANKNEVFELLKKLAEEIKRADDGIGSEKAREMITEIDRQTDVETQWEQFRIRFESVHRSFFDKLRKADGGLTQNDLQLCAYLKLNLTTKEIARLMNISPESVNTSRYRLRKKLNLNNHITLDEFIHTL
ncbi:MAG: tetratricopeptide repeat protein [Bacteroidales bacterium]|nr:tetratricopeptide repeat protein [Bacteroidales bacterium]